VSARARMAERPADRGAAGYGTIGRALPRVAGTTRYCSVDDGTRCGTAALGCEADRPQTTLIHEVVAILQSSRDRTIGPKGRRKHTGQRTRETQLLSRVSFASKGRGDLRSSVWHGRETGHKREPSVGCVARSGDRPQPEPPTPPVRHSPVRGCPPGSSARRSPWHVRAWWLECRSRE